MTHATTYLYVIKRKYCKIKILKINALTHLDAVFILLINIKMATIAGILTCMSRRIKSVHSLVDHEKKRITISMPVFSYV